MGSREAGGPWRAAGPGSRCAPTQICGDPARPLLVAAGRAPGSRLALWPHAGTQWPGSAAGSVSRGPAGWGGPAGRTPGSYQSGSGHGGWSRRTGATCRGLEA